MIATCTRCRILAALVLGACRPEASAPPIDHPPQRRADPAESTAPFEILDFTSAGSAACAQLDDGDYRCWGAHAAFPELLGLPASDRSGTVLEAPTRITRLPNLRRLALTAHVAWAVTDTGELVAWPDEWRPGVGSGVRDVAASDLDMCIRRGEDVVCWAVSPTQRIDARVFESTGEAMVSRDGRPPPPGRLVQTQLGLHVETDLGCRRLLGDGSPGGREDLGDPTPGPCGLLDERQLEDLQLPPGTIAVQRGACMLVEGTRLLCRTGSGYQVVRGRSWDPRPRLVARAGAAVPRFGCIASGSSLSCEQGEYVLPSGTIQQIVASGSSRDEEGPGFWVVASDGVVYARAAGPTLQPLGRWKSPPRVVPLRAASCLVDESGALWCQHGEEPYARVRGLPKLDGVHEHHMGWVARERNGELWHVARPRSDETAHQVTPIGAGDPLVLVQDGLVVRAPDGGLQIVDFDAKLQPLDPGTSLSRFLGAEDWAQLVPGDELVCGRTRTGVVGCTAWGPMTSTLPIGLENDPRFTRPDLPRPATDLFWEDRMCARAENGDIACWGRVPYRYTDDWIDVTPRLPAG